MRFENFIGPTYQHRGVDVDAERCVNLYPEFTESAGAKEKKILVGTPGRSVWLKLSPATAGGIRGMYVASNGNKYVVASDTLFRILIPSGTPTAVSIGSIGSIAGRVSMTDNGTDLIIADGQTLWRHNFSANDLNSVANAPSNPSHVAYLAGRIYANDGTQNVVRYCELPAFGGASTWPSLNVFSAEGSPDPLSAIAVVQGELWCWGPNSFEAFRTSGNPDQPLVRAGGSWSGVGIIAPQSVTLLNDRVFWIGGGKDGRNIVYTNNGYTASRVSNHAIEYSLESMASVTDCVGWSYAQEGHWFYCMQFPTGNKTWVFDMTTGQWHERADRNKNSNVLTRWKPTYCMQAFDTFLCGDDSSSVIYELSLDYYEDQEVDSLGVTFTKPIQRIRRAPLMWDDMKRIVHRYFKLDCEVGQGLTTGQGSDPQAMLRYSDDAGRTFSNERWANMGQQGQYKQEVRWNMLGMSRKRVYEVVITEPVRVLLIGASIGVDQTAGP